MATVRQIRTIRTPAPAVRDSPQGDSFDESLHALPAWFAWFQKTFGLSFIVLAEAYLMGSLAVEGWVKELTFDAVFGSFRGVGVIFFFLAGVAVAGIGLTCSVVFVGSVKRRQPFMAIFTGLGMLIFFGVEVWSSLSERSLYLLATPADLAVLEAFGFKGRPPISPTILVVSLLFPLGSMFFGFVQQRRAAVTEADLAEDEMEMRRRIRQAELEAQLVAAEARKNAARARGAVGVLKAGAEALRQQAEPTDSAHALPAGDEVTDDEEGDDAENADETGEPTRTRRRWEEMDADRARMLAEGYALSAISERGRETIWQSLTQRRRRPQLQVLLGWDDAQIDARIEELRAERQQVTGKRS